MPVGNPVFHSQLVSDTEMDKVTTAGHHAEPLQKELRRSQPDYIVYVPGSFDGSTHDGHNEHFLVFDGPDGSLMAIWTQNFNAPDGPVGNRIVSVMVSSGLTAMFPEPTS